MSDVAEDLGLLQLEDPVSLEALVPDPASEHYPLLLGCGHTVSRGTVRQVNLPLHIRCSLVSLGAAGMGGIARLARRKRFQK